MPIKLTHPRQTLPSPQNLNNSPNLPNLRNPVLAGGYRNPTNPKNTLAGNLDCCSAGSAGFKPPPSRSQVIELKYCLETAEKIFK